MTEPFFNVIFIFAILSLGFFGLAAIRQSRVR
jgi:hypothetical protein